MKKCILGVIYFLYAPLMTYAQVYPDPDLVISVLPENRKYFTAVRLENISKVETETKPGGFGAFEYGYTIEGLKSSVRLNSGSLSFIYSTSGIVRQSSLETDSIMRAHGVDPSMVAGRPEENINAKEWRSYSFFR